METRPCFDRPIRTRSASPVSAGYTTVPTPSGSAPHFTTVRHMIFGTPAGVQTIIDHLYTLNYANPSNWSKPVPTGQSGEVVAILTKKIRVV